MASAATRTCGAGGARAFERDFRVVLFDHVGAGRSDLAAYDSAKYSTLDGYADDVVEIGRELDLQDAVFVGHSVSAMIGALASLKAPGMFSDLVMVGPSPRYIDDGDYVGGFSRQQIEELLEFLADNHLGWSAAMAPAIMGNPDRPELGEELTNSFCATDPEIARRIRPRHLPVRQPRRSAARSRRARSSCNAATTSSRRTAVGEYVHAQIPGSQFHAARRDRPLPQSERAGGSDGRDPCLCLRHWPDGGSRGSLRECALRLSLAFAGRPHRQGQPDTDRLAWDLFGGSGWASPFTSC